MVVVIPDPPTVYLKEHADHLEFAPNSVVYLSNHLGELQIKICDLCGYETIRCMHIRNRTDFEKNTITCLLCGE